MTQKSYSDTTPPVTNTYDVQPAGSPIAISNPVGRLTKVATTTGGVTVSNYYSYCSCSTVEKEATVITDGITRTYVTSYTYNLLGQVSQITYPNGRIVTYTRDAVGRESRVSSSVGSQAIDYVRAAEYLGPHGGLSRIQYGISWYQSPPMWLETTFSYSPKTLRMTNLKTHGLNLNYSYRIPGSYPYI